MRKPISTIKLTDTLNLSECHDGFWLYDKTRGMNLAMRSKTSTDALVKAIMYYQNRLINIEQLHKELKKKVDVFVDQFITANEDE